MTSYWKDKRFSEEHRRKLSEARKGKVGYFKDKHFTKIHRKHLSLALKGRKLSATQKENVSRGVREWWSKPENKELMSKAHMGISTKGWHHTKEAKEKMRQARLGKPHPYKRSIERGWKLSEEGKKNIGKARKRWWSTLKKENPDRYEEITKHMSEVQQRRRHSNKTGEKSE